MKIKDLEKHLPCFVTLQNSYSSGVRWATEIAVVKGGTSFYGARRPDVKKVLCTPVRYSPDNDALVFGERNQYGSDDYMPGQIGGVLDHQAAHQMLANKYNALGHQRWVHSMGRAHAKALTDALHAAGFTTARRRHDSVVFEAADIATWAKDQGLGLPTDEEV
jgi:hypothetical protein